MSKQCDIIVRNGTIVDGTGTKKYVGDVIINRVPGNPRKKLYPNQGTFIVKGWKGSQ